MSHSLIPGASFAGAGLRAMRGVATSKRIPGRHPRAALGAFAKWRQIASKAAGGCWHFTALIPIILTGCPADTPQPATIWPGEFNYALELSTNLVVLQAGPSGSTGFYRSNWPSFSSSYNLAAYTNGTLTVAPPDPGSSVPNPTQESFPGNGVALTVGAHLVKLTENLKLRHNNSAARSSVSAVFTVLVQGVAQQPPPATTPPPPGPATNGSFGALAQLGLAALQGDGSTSGIDAPLSLIEGSDGFLYGVASVAESNAFWNTIVKFDKAGSNAKVLLRFDTNTAALLGDGLVASLARVRIAESGTNRTVLIGATRGGPGIGTASYSGTVFRLNEDGTGLQVLHTFPQWTFDDSQGTFPRFITSDRFGYVYGTTLSGGNHLEDAGTIFRLWADGSGFRVLRTFRSPAGRGENELLVGSNDRLFGTVNNRGAGAPVAGFFPGGLFSADADGGFLKSDFHTFDLPPVNPNYGGLYYYWNGPQGGLVESSNGFLYGAHGLALGEISTYARQAIPLQTNVSFYYRISKDGRGFVRMAYVPARQTPAPQALVQGSDGRLYGFLIEKTNLLVALHPETGALETVMDLGPAQTSSYSPHPHTTGGLVSASDGALYGTVLVGGADNKGFLFRYMPTTNAALPKPRPGVTAKASMQTQPNSGVTSGRTATTAWVATIGTNYPGQRAGRSIALSNDRLVAGVPLSDNPLFQGAAHVFRRSGTNWNAEAVLTPPSGDSVRLFGVAAAMDGEWLAIGAPGLLDTNLFAGAVYVFTRTNGAWQPHARITGQNLGDDEFGAAVGLSETNLIVGAPGETNGGRHAGGAWVFSRNAAGNWIMQSHVTAGAKTNDYFGTSVAIRANNAVVGAPKGRGLDIPFERGAAHILTYSKPFYIWSPSQVLESDLSYAGDFFGASVAISSNRILVGMPGSLPFDSIDARNDRRGVIVFNLANFIWSESSRIVPDQFQNLEVFGASLCFDGSRVTVGAPHDPEFFVGPKGSAYVFDAQGTKWVQTARLQVSAAQTNDAFGLAVAHWNDTVAVSAIAQLNPNAMPGAVHLFELGWVEPPLMTISQVPAGMLIKWNPSGTGFTLKSSSSLGNNANWQAVQPAPTNASCLVPPSGLEGYFRLEKH
jgi:hypothetical protein